MAALTFLKEATTDIGTVLKQTRSDKNSEITVG
jgi:hypothetical protein